MSHYGDNLAALLNSGQFEANCLVKKKEASGSSTEINYDVGKPGGATTPKAGDAHGNIP